MTDIKSNSEQPKISPPWYTLQRVVSFSIGQSGQVMVSELEGSDADYQIMVITLKEATAQALANTLKLRHEIGNITVTIVVKDLSGKTYEHTPHSNEGRIDLLKEALVNNPLVFGIEEFKRNAAICCTPTVIQFWNDNIANPYSFTSMMSEDAFREVFLDDISVYTLGKKIGNF